MYKLPYLHLMRLIVLEPLEGLGYKVKLRALNSGLHAISIAKDGLAGGRSQTRRYSVGPITVSKQIWPTLHYADRPIPSIIGKTFANFFGMLHLQSCFKKLTIFGSRCRLDRFFLSII